MSSNDDDDLSLSPSVRHRQLVRRSARQINRATARAVRAQLAGNSLSTTNNTTAAPVSNNTTSSDSRGSFVHVHGSANDESSFASVAGLGAAAGAGAGARGIVRIASKGQLPQKPAQQQQQQQQQQQLQQQASLLQALPLAPAHLELHDKLEAARAGRLSASDDSEESWEDSEESDEVDVRGGRGGGGAAAAAAAAAVAGRRGVGGANGDNFPEWEQDDTVHMCVSCGNVFSLFRRKQYVWRTGCVGAVRGVTRTAHRLMRCDVTRPAVCVWFCVCLTVVNQSLSVLRPRVLR